MNRTEAILKREIRKVLINQGYSIKKGAFFFDEPDQKEIRQMHQFSRAERIKENIDFIQTFLPEASQYILDSSKIKVANIKPRLIEIKSGTAHGELFRWWNLVWWSLPHERAYGRQMRFLVWDDYHNSPIGLIGLHSPILSWSVRDKYLGISIEQRDYWVNQSLSAQRLGALPPYNKFLGGKLVASLMMSDLIRKSFKKKYNNSKTLLQKRVLPANLLFITTTGAYGKSSVYNRLKFHNEKICDFIGYTQGYGSFHIPNTIYEGFVSYLNEKGYKAGRGFGNGPSVKMKNINKTMHLLGFRNGCEHGMKRAVYLFPFVKNLDSVIQNNKRPIWYKRNIDDLTDYWKERWACKRSGNGKNNFFDKESYLKELSKDLKNCKKLTNKKF